jgi:hypothetical protein
MQCVAPPMAPHAPTLLDLVEESLDQVAPVIYTGTALIQSASNPRSPSNIAPDFGPDGCLCASH